MPLPKASLNDLKINAVSVLCFTSSTCAPDIATDIVGIHSMSLAAHARASRTRNELLWTSLVSLSFSREHQRPKQHKLFRIGCSDVFPSSGTHHEPEARNRMPRCKRGMDATSVQEGYTVVVQKTRLIKFHVNSSLIVVCVFFFSNSDLCCAEGLERSLTKTCGARKYLPSLSRDMTLTQFSCGVLVPTTACGLFA